MSASLKFDPFAMEDYGNHQNIFTRKIGTGNDQKDVQNVPISVISSDPSKFFVKPLNTFSSSKNPTPSLRVTKAYKYYSKKSPPVIKNFNMTVPRGIIYGLLGSSGCGKTTILNCCVGLGQLTEGIIKVFGNDVGTPESGVPGPRIGYMPQEIALHELFSIEETLYYYGRIYGISPDNILKRNQFLIDMLHLPKGHRRVGSLSGGQKRRVSLAVALIHEPDLLIMDEPTVGIDPLLRKNIWDHIFRVVRESSVTAIITTHYIEETRDFHVVGLMRSGRLIAEDSPNDLLKRFNTMMLENVVLQLCQYDELNDDENIFVEDNQDILLIQEAFEENSPHKDSPEDKNISSAAALNRIMALVIKNFKFMTRNIVFILFLFILPASQVTVMCLAIGNDPIHMRFGVVNYEHLGKKCPQLDPDDCKEELISCTFINLLSPEVLDLEIFESEEEAIRQVDLGNSWGYLLIKEEFSDSMLKRFMSTKKFLTQKSLDGLTIVVRQDKSNSLIAQYIMKELYFTYKDFIAYILKSCGFDEKMAEIPLKFVDPLYGTQETNFREFLAVNTILGIIFFFPLSSSCLAYMLDKMSGTTARGLVAGVKHHEVILSYMITEGTVLVFQTVITFAIVVLVFGIEVKGSILLAILLTVCVGFGGISLGLFAGTVSRELVTATLFAMAFFMPNMIFSGVIWPLEGMPTIMQKFSHILPCTLACEALRSIVTRGWHFYHFHVWPGFASASLWIIVYWAAILLIIRFKRF